MNIRGRLFTFLLIAVAACLVGAAPLKAQQRPFSTGTANGTALGSCTADPGGVTGNCWGLDISCPDVTGFEPYDATVKITQPAGQSIGTVIFITDGGGNGYYDTYFTYGSSVIQTVVNAGFTAAQIAFNNPVAGWLTGPAGDGNGPITLACLPATAMQWVYNNVLAWDTPLCATGNGGGASAIAYALSQYGLGSILTLAEPTSGPDMSRLDYGCSASTKYSACAVCGSGMQYESYGLSNAEQYVDPAYTGANSGRPNGPCSKGIQGSTGNASKLHTDSILSQTYPPLLSFSAQVRALFGGLENGDGAIPEGFDWVAYVASSAIVMCVPTAGRELPSYQAGANQLENDLINYCRLP
jgi:hypothetical protein